MEFEKMKRIAVFSGSSNPRLSDEIAHELGISLGNVKLEKFANGPSLMPSCRRTRRWLPDTSPIATIICVRSAPTPGSWLKSCR